MDKKNFIRNKERLLAIINSLKENKNISNSEKQAIENLSELLNKYSFENRLKMKGALTRTIIDSLELDYSLGENFIKFDNSIN